MVVSITCISTHVPGGMIQVYPYFSDGLKPSTGELFERNVACWGGWCKIGRALAVFFARNWWTWYKWGGQINDHHGDMGSSLQILYFTTFYVHVYVYIYIYLYIFVYSNCYFQMIVQLSKPVVWTIDRKQNQQVVSPQSTLFGKMRRARFFCSFSPFYLQ